MSKQTDKIRAFLKNLGINKEESDIYIYLLGKREKSPLEISRALEMGRTKVYRILENLQKTGLVIENIEKHGKRYKASSPAGIEILIKKKEVELEKLKETKTKVLKELSFYKARKDNKSKVLYYEGKNGLKQITWNSLSARDELFIFEASQSMNPFTGKAFAEKVREEFFLRKIITKQLTNFKSIEKYTDVQQYVKNCWKVKYVDPKDLCFKFEILIYNDIVAIYTYKNNEYFGVEITNENLSSMQKQLFRYIWKKALSMDIYDGGRARIAG